MRLAVWTIISFSLVYSASAYGVGALQGKPTSITDGDTIIINGHKIRFHGIDTPEPNERCQRKGEDWDCGGDATRALTERIGSGVVECDAVGADRFGRITALCFVGDTMLNDWLVRNGWGLDYTRYSHCAFRKAEQSAKKLGLNLWAEGVTLTPKLVKRLDKRKKNCPT